MDVKLIIYQHVDVVIVQMWYHTGVNRQHMVGIWASIMGIWLAEVWQVYRQQRWALYKYIIYIYCYNEAIWVGWYYDRIWASASGDVRIPTMRNVKTTKFKSIQQEAEGSLQSVWRYSSSSHSLIVILSSFSAFVGPWKKKHWFSQIPNCAVHWPPVGTCGTSRAQSQVRAWMQPEQIEKVRNGRAGRAKARRSDGRCF